MSERTVERIAVYSPLSATPEEARDGIGYHPRGDLPHPEAIDTAIEDSEAREKLPANGGNISVTVLAGEDLGDISVNIQFEGKRGLHDQCLHNQGALLDAASGWIGEMLDELGGDFIVAIDARPCPHTTERLPLKRAADNLLGRAHTRAVARGISVTVEATHQVKT